MKEMEHDPPERSERNLMLLTNLVVAQAVLLRFCLLLFCVICNG